MNKFERKERIKNFCKTIMIPLYVNSTYKCIRWVDSYKYLIRYSNAKTLSCSTVKFIHNLIDFSLDNGIKIPALTLIEVEFDRLRKGFE